MTIDREKLLTDGLDLPGELAETLKALREVTLMIEQSQGELTKLAQRNAAITAHLQQVQAKLDQTAPQEIRMAYDAALDAQQRLFVMRAQLDKLQSDRNHLEKYRNLLQQSNSAPAALESGSPAAPGKTPMAEIEMIVNAQEAERQRLSRQMHDGPAQALSNFILQTEIAMRLLDVDPVQAKNELGNLKVAAMSTFQKVRNFIFELRPMMLDDLGVAPTIRRYADTFKEQAGVEVSIMISGTERRLEPYLEVMIFRSMQELLSYAVHTNQATVVKIQMDMGDALVRLSMDDNGKGMDTDQLAKEPNLGLK